MSSTPRKNRSGLERKLFPRSHHLKRKRLIEPLFEQKDRSAKSVAFGSIRIVYRLVRDADLDRPNPFQIGFAVGRSSGSAVQRNRIKRIIREAVRLNQECLIPPDTRSDEVLTAMIIFRGNHAESTSTASDVRQCLERLQANLFRNEDAPRKTEP